MHYIKPYQTAVTLFGCDGSCYVYESLKTALKALGFSWISHHVGREFKTYQSARLNSVYNPKTKKLIEVLSPFSYVYAEFIMRDDFGEPVTALDFDRIRAKKKYRSYCYALWNGEGPVPGTAKGKAGSHHYRRIRCKNALLAAECFEEEGEAAPRADRNQGNLPNSWDDYHVSGRRNNNWKRFRKTRWK